MIICGEKDKANIRAAITMNKIILNAKLYLIRQAGHEVNIEAPEELANLIEKFWIGNK
jgi:pimeloyl-ACP methyl ester carboxylesterase